MSTIRKKPGFGLEQNAFTDPAVFEKEKRNIFAHNWFLAAHISELEADGDFITLQLGDYPILIVKKGRDILAFHNICKHKGCVLIAAPRGNRQKIICPYHSWIYELNGVLTSARGIDPEINRQDLSLEMCRIGICGGFIFVCPEEPIVAWKEIAAGYDRYFGIYLAETCRITASDNFLVKANWKILIENFEECYHCTSIHPEYTAIMAHALPESTCSVSALETFDKYFEEFKKNSLVIGHPSGQLSCDPKSVIWAGRYPLKEHVESQTRDGKSWGPLLGNWEIKDGGVCSFRLRPGSYILGPQDYLLSVTFIPVTNDTTEVKMNWYTQKANDLSHVQTKELKWLWEVTTKQDNAICEQTQKGIQSPIFKAGPLSVSEEFIESFHEWYIDQMNN